jgi:hypothetical protein
VSSSGMASKIEIIGQFRGLKERSFGTLFEGKVAEVKGGGLLFPQSASDPFLRKFSPTSAIRAYVKMNGIFRSTIYFKIIRYSKEG